MASAAVRSKLVALLLFIHCLLLLSFFVLLCSTLCPFFNFAVSLGKRELAVLLLLCSECHVAVICVCSM